MEYLGFSKSKLQFFTALFEPQIHLKILRITLSTSPFVTQVRIHPNSVAGVKICHQTLRQLSPQICRLRPFQAQSFSEVILPHPRRPIPSRKAQDSPSVFQEVACSQTKTIYCLCSEATEVFAKIVTQLILRARTILLWPFTSRAPLLFPSIFLCSLCPWDPLCVSTFNRYFW